MTLRTRIPHRSGAAGGPGRTRLSDTRLSDTRRSGGRIRHRRRGDRHRRARVPQVDPEVVRRRAEALLGGSGPPSAEAVPPEPAAELPDEAAPRDPTMRGLAVRERLPVWLQARCGVEPRTVGAVAVVLVVAVGFAAQQYWSARPRPVTAPAVVAPAAAPAAATAPAGAPRGSWWTSAGRSGIRGCGGCPPVRGWRTHWPPPGVCGRARTPPG
ncbi:hypothetical protein ACU4GG_15315 [Streptomyces nojiriensis]